MFWAEAVEMGLPAGRRPCRDGGGGEIARCRALCIASLPLQSSLMSKTYLSRTPSMGVDHDDHRQRKTLGSAGDWERYHEKSVHSFCCCRRFDRDWFWSMGGRTHQSARPLDRSGDRTLPTHDERKGPP